MYSRRGRPEAASLPQGPAELVLQLVTQHHCSALEVYLDRSNVRTTSEVQAGSPRIAASQVGSSSNQ